MRKIDIGIPVMGQFPCLHLIIAPLTTTLVKFGFQNHFLKLASHAVHFHKSQHLPNTEIGGTKLDMKIDTNVFMPYTDLIIKF